MRCCYARCLHRATKQIAKPTVLALASPATGICVCIVPSLIAAIAFCQHVPWQTASPHALSHPRRTDHLIKKETHGNLPNSDSVAMWHVIKTLMLATPEEVLQLAFGAACALMLPKGVRKSVHEREIVF